MILEPGKKLSIMKNVVVGLIIIFSVHFSAQKSGNEITLDNESKGIRPTLFANILRIIKILPVSQINPEYFVCK